MNSRNHIKMQKFVIFVKKSLKINILKIKNIVKLEDFEGQFTCKEKILKNS